MRGFLVLFATAIVSYCDAKSSGAVLPERFEVRQRANDDFILPGYGSKSRDDALPPVDSMMIAVNTGAKIDPTNKRSDGVEKIHKAIAGYFKNSDRDPKSPLFRARDQYNIKPEIISMGDSGQSSLKVELTAQSIMKALKDLLSSDKVRVYTELVARKAAVLYRTVQQEMAKERRQRGAGGSRGRTHARY